MQDQYVGDIGDYAKYALLRALIKDRSDLRSGVAWYLHPDQGNADGKHITYLKNPKAWKPVDPKLFEGLKDIIDKWKAGTGKRSVEEVKNRSLLGDAVFPEAEVLRFDTKSNSDRKKWRYDWFKKVDKDLKGCRIVFADPDNGLRPDKLFSYSNSADLKRLPLSEALRLSDEGRPAIIYHHNSRFSGGHCAEIRWWMEQLSGCALAFYVRRGTARTFFICNPDLPMLDGLAKFVGKWQEAEKRADVKPSGFSKLIWA